MACTIDHLRVDHRVIVLREFADLAGNTLRPGEAGILRGLGADFARMEIWIELEREGTSRKLRFALRAPEGPRIGRMKDYFDLGEPVEIEERPLPPPPPEPAPPAGPRRPPLPLPPGAGGQVPDNTHLGELRVACDCDPAFHRELLSARGGLDVFACLRCGTVTGSRGFGDDGRFTGEAWQEFRAVGLAEPVHRWIAGWPRVKPDYTAGPRWPMSADLVRYPTLYYPADTRCADLAQLAALEARLVREQAGQSAAARLRATHRVRTGPPAGMPKELCGYPMLWEALQLRPDSRLSDLVHLAQPGSPGKDLAAEMLGRRADAPDLVLAWLRSPDAAQRGTGFVVARDLRPVDPRLAGVLIDLLTTLPFERLPDVPRGIASRGRFEMILLLIAELGLATPEVIATVRTLMRKFARHDDFLADCARIVLRELTAGAPARSDTD